MAHGAAAGENAAGAFLDGHDRGFVEHEPFAGHADQRVGGAQVNGQVGAQQSEKSMEHPCSRVVVRSLARRPNG